MYIAFMNTNLILVNILNIKDVHKSIQVMNKHHYLDNTIQYTKLTYTF